MWTSSWEAFALGNVFDRIDAERRADRKPVKGNFPLIVRSPSISSLTEFLFYSHLSFYIVSPNRVESRNAPDRRDRGVWPKSRSARPLLSRRIRAIIDHARNSQKTALNRLSEGRFAFVQRRRVLLPNERFLFSILSNEHSRPSNILATNRFLAIIPIRIRSFFHTSHRNDVRSFETAGRS